MSPYTKKMNRYRNKKIPPSMLDILRIQSASKKSVLIR